MHCTYIYIYLSVIIVIQRGDEPIIGYLNSGESSGQIVSLQCKRGIWCKLS